MNTLRNRPNKLTLTALFTVLIIVCSQIQIPFTIPFTLQTFAVALSCLILGPKMALVSVLAYILLGCIGVPTFSGFTGSFGVILGPTGGYIIGFIPMVICYMILHKTFHNFCKKHQVLCLSISLIACYTFGTLQYINFAFSSTNFPDFITIFKTCVLPFVVFDIIKIYLAKKVSYRLISIYYRLM